MSTMLRHHRLLLAASFLICLVMTVAALVWASDPVRFAAKMMRLAPADRWVDYAWQSDTRLIVSRWRPGRCYLTQVETTKDGAELPLKRLNDRLAGQMRIPLALKVSPDGAWLLWADGDGRRAWRYVAALDGSRLSRWPIRLSDVPVSPETNHAWLPNGLTWGELRHGTNSSLLLLRGVEVSNQPQTIPVLVPNTGPGNASERPNALLGFLADGRALIKGWSVMYAGQANTLPLYEVPSRGARQMVRTHLLRAPEQVWPAEVVLSPRRDRLAWTFWNLRTGMMTIQVSRADGSAMKTLGAIKVGGLPSAASRPVPAQPRLLRWTPDGKSVSFLYKDALYLVRVP